MAFKGDLSSLLESSWQIACLDGMTSVLASVSGGADSMALLLALLKGGWRVRVAHVNFGLRGEASDGDEAFVAAFCTARGVPFECRRVSDAERETRRGESVQEWARRIRREWLLSIRRGDEAIALAHHRDDLIETVVMRLLRGASAEHVLGMEGYSRPWWRPWLEIPKAEIIRWYSGQELPHREDASNATLDYSRNTLRNSVLPQLERLFPGCSNRLLAHAQECRDLAQAVTTILPDFADGIPRRWLREQPKAVALNAIVSLFGSGTRRTLSRAFLELVLTRATEQQGCWAAQVPGGGTLDLDETRLSFSPVAKASFSARRRQHERGLMEQRARAILTLGSCVTFQDVGGSFQGGIDPVWIDHVTSPS